MPVDDTVLKKVESAIEVAKFAPKANTPPAITDLLEEWDAHMKALHEIHHLMKEAWNDVAGHMMSVHRRINK